jgi:hypothetical protein
VADSTPLASWADATCLVCPAQRLGPGGFDVVDCPGARYRLDRDLGYRVDVETGTAVCVHPFRVGLAPGAYASAGPELRPVEAGAVFTPSPEQLALPDAVDDLEAWLIAMLRTADPTMMASALEQAEAIAAERFSGDQIVGALRRVLAHELAG